MVKDRLHDLLQASQNSLCNKSSDVVNLNMEVIGNKTIDEILNEYGEIRTSMAIIGSNLDTMSRIMQKPNFGNFNENEMENLRTSNLKIGQQLMVKFRDLRNNLPPEDDYCLEARMKRTLFYGLHQSFINVWNKNEIFLQSYETKLKKNLQMHTKILNFNSTEEEVEELLSNNTTSLFVGNILEETERERKTLRDLMERFSELKKLEKSIEDVHTLFIRIQNLVLEQNDRIQIVEYHAQQASIQVDKGAVELDKANVLQKKVLRKKTCLIIVGVTVLFLFILLLFV